MKNIVILGGGSIGTAMGHIASSGKNQSITILSVEKDVVNQINTFNYNTRYFPGIRLNPLLKASCDVSILHQAGYILLATPSAVTVDYLISLKPHIKPGVPLINLAKGFGNQQKTIYESLKQEFLNPVCSLKGPSFARELIQGAPTAFTFASEDESIFQEIQAIFENTGIITDYSSDVLGVELISILKNIYAIVAGIADARFNSPNLKFLLLSKAFSEMREILLQFGGKESTLFNYCGFGDFTLTALNDLSRNRTLGLFIGKGFFSKDISDKVLLEGKIATKVFCEEISRKNSVMNHHIIEELYKVFTTNYDIAEFVANILKR